MATLPLRLVAFGMIAWGSWTLWGPRLSGPTADIRLDLLRSRVAEIEDRFQLQVGTAAVEEFQRDIDDIVPDTTLLAAESDPRQAALALSALERALELYPKNLLQFHLRGVFLAASVKIDGEYDVGGTYTNHAIYIVTDFIESEEDARWVERAFHHEFSSLLYSRIINDDMPDETWDAQNVPGFVYPNTRDDELRAATNSPLQGPPDEWYAQGFVSDYGRSSRENDVNTYAELLMAEPEQLMKLAVAWPRIRAKAEILARFYARIDPVLEAHLRASPAGALLRAPD